jgi:hypothetical protein
MLSAADRIKADLVALQESLDHCSDTGLRKLIESWIQEKKRLLAETKSQSSPANKKSLGK